MNTLGSQDDWPHDALTDIEIGDVVMGKRMERALRLRRFAAVAGSFMDGFADSRSMAAERWHPGMAPEMPTDTPQPPDDWYPPDPPDFY